MLLCWVVFLSYEYPEMPFEHFFTEYNAVIAFHIHVDAVGGFRPVMIVLAFIFKPVSNAVFEPDDIVKDVHSYANCYSNRFFHENFLNNFSNAC